MIIAKRTGKKKLINFLIENGAKTIDEQKSTGKMKKSAS